MKYSKDILEDYAVNMHNIGSLKQFISKHKEWLDDILKFQQNFHFEDFTFQQVVYHYCYDITTEVVCRSGNPKKFKGFRVGYEKLCIEKRKCKTCSEDFNERRRKTYLQKYGVDHPLKCKEVLDKMKKTCLEKYGTTYALENKSVREKIKNTNIERYGVDNVFAVEKYKEKIKNTNIERYGVEYAQQCKDIRDKRFKTLKDKYGCDYFFQSNEFKEKSKITVLERYGVDNIQKSDIIKEKIKKTCLIKYGATNISQSEEGFTKIMNALYTTKDYVMPSGKIVKVQGYEPQALDFLLKDIDEHDVLISSKEYTPKIGKIYYELNGKQHRYFPDIVVRNENDFIIYEVKSTYTYKIGMEDNSLVEKMKACNKLGYNAIVVVFDGNGNLLFEINITNKNNNDI